MLSVKSAKRARIKIILYIVLTLILVLAGAGTAGYLWYNDAVNTPAGTTSEIATVEITEGANLIEAAPQLVSAGVLKNADAFRIYLRLNPGKFNFQAGKYEIPQNLNVAQLLDHLSKGPKVLTLTFTIPEGKRADEIAAILQLKTTGTDSLYSNEHFMDIVNAPDAVDFTPEVQDFLDKHKPAGKPLEGFIFPDTYTIAMDADAQHIIELMIQTLMSRLVENNVNADESGRLDSFYEVLNLASITEREANTTPDRKLVADVFLKRLESGTVLGSDVTLLYVLKDWTYELTLAQLNDRSNPYNSRLLPGLPPTPISNPGIDSIAAILNPTPNDYYYFIAANDVVYYARTLFEHEQNIVNYL